MLETFLYLGWKNIHPIGLSWLYGAILRIKALFYLRRGNSLLFLTVLEAGRIIASIRTLFASEHYLPMEKISGVDLGTLDYSKYSYGYYASNASQTRPSGDTQNTVICTLFPSATFTEIYDKTVDSGICINPSGHLSIRSTLDISASDFKALMSGVYAAWQRKN